MGSTTGSPPPGPEGSGPRPTRGRVGRLVEWLVPDDNPAAQVYGALTSGTLLAAESARRETLPEAIGGVALVLVLYWLSHAYAAALGERLADAVPFSARRVLRVAAHEFALVRGSLLPLAAMVASALAGASDAAVVTSGLVASAVVIVGLEVLAALRSRPGRSEIAVEVAITVAIALGVLSLRFVVH